MEVIVVGAGPAGSMAAKAVAEKGYSVTVYEKGPLRREKPCGGAVSDRVIREFGLELRDSFWERMCMGIFLCSPENRTVLLTERKTGGCLVMRESFDYYLAQQAQKAGAHFVENTFCQPATKNGKVMGIKTEKGIMEADVVIACDGTPSACARTLGIYRGNDRNQAATFQYQMRMEEKEIDEKIGDYMEIYFGHKWMPYGYCWIFPKKNTVTVGGGTWLFAMRKYKINVKERLDTFVREHLLASEKLKNAQISYPQSAMIGFRGVVEPIFLDNFLIAGDAGGFVSVPTGEGIYYSMISGRAAGEVAAEALQKKDTSSKSLGTYKKKVDKVIGGDMKWGYWLRRLIMDEEKNQEKMVRTALKDTWVYNMTGQLIGGEIPYKTYLLNYVRRPHKLVKFWLA